MPSHGELRDIATAIAPHVNRTPLLRSTALGKLLGCEVWLKAELFQKTGAYKPRGMINALRQMSPEIKARGVITFSAGNAAQGLAYAASVYGIKAVACMPANASPIKVQATQGYGGEAVLHGTSKDAFERMHQLIAEHGYTYVPPSDDPVMIAGNASMGLEIHDDAPDADLVIAPIGGGGMISGVATGLRAAGSKARIIGVEPEGAATMYGSLAAGKPTDLATPPNTIADGLAYPFGGKYTYPIVKELVEQVVLVSDEEIRQAMLQMMMRTKLYAEPSAAAPLAALTRYREMIGPVKKVVLVISGGNLDPDRLKTLI